MNNENTRSSENADIRIDSSSISILLHAHAPLAGKILLVVGGIIFLAPCVLFVFMGLGFIVSTAYGVIWSLTMGRMILWNLFGREHLTITAQYVEFQHHYGLFQTGTHRHPLHGVLTIKTIHKREQKGIMYGRMEMTTINEIGHQTLILKTGVHLPQEQIDYIISATISLLDRTTSHTF